MADKLVQGDKLPRLKLNFIDGGTTVFPDDMQGRYLALLFFRGDW